MFLNFSIFSLRSRVQNSFDLTWTLSLGKMLIPNAKLQMFAHVLLPGKAIREQKNVVSYINKHLRAVKLMPPAHTKTKTRQRKKSKS